MNTDAQTLQLLAILAILVSFALAELVQGRFFAPEATREDNRLDIAVTLLFPLISGGVLATSGALCAWLMPDQRNALAHWSWWQMVLLLLLADDLTQYLWHRLSHTSFMWPLHRAHHRGGHVTFGPSIISTTLFIDHSNSHCNDIALARQFEHLFELLNNIFLDAVAFGDEFHDFRHERSYGGRGEEAGRWELSRAVTLRLGQTVHRPGSSQRQTFAG